MGRIGQVWSFSTSYPQGSATIWLIWQLTEKLYPRGLSQLDLIQSLIFTNSPSWGRLSKKKKLRGNLKSQLPEAVISNGANKRLTKRQKKQKQKNPWGMKNTFSVTQKAMIMYKIITCLGKTLEGPNLSPLVIPEALSKQEIKAKVDRVVNHPPEHWKLTQHTIKRPCMTKNTDFTELIPESHQTSTTTDLG